MHNNALDIRKKTATPRQRALIESRLVHLQPELIDEVMSSKTVDEITGDEARVIIDRLKEIGDTVGYPPSEKQSALILKLADQIGIGLDGVLEMAGVSDISALTGGGSGTASELIGTLIEKSKELPATESQVDLIGKLAEQNDKQISELLTIVGARDISELTKNDASTIISKIKGRSRGRRRKKNS